MANSNFVVHNGLTVGPTTIDAASGNVVIPVGKQILIGNVILRDNGDGKLAVRDKTDNSDVVIVATVSATSSTQGNIQIGTNHIESINANGPISIRPNGTGNIALSSNTIDVGRGGVTTITTGGTFTGANLTLAPGGAGFVVVTGNLQVTGATTTAALSATNVTASGTLGVTGQVTLGGVLAGPSTFTIDPAAVGDDTGTVVIKGNLQVDGTTVTVNSATLSVTDKNITVAKDAANAAAADGAGLTVAGASATMLYTSSTDTFNFNKGLVSTSAVLSGAITINSGNGVTAIINGGTNGVGNIGSSTTGFNTVFAKSTSAQYADLAENYQADAAYEAGTVVHFGGEFEVTACDMDGCTSVAGVVSTAPAHLMNTGLVGANVVALALTGRVPCLVQGTVRKGDLMVSAGNGRARAEANPRVGSVIGKSLENFDGLEGVIEVVVGIR